MTVYLVLTQISNIPAKTKISDIALLTYL